MNIPSQLLSKKLFLIFKTKSTTCGYQCSTVGCFVEDKKSKSKKGHNSEKTAFSDKDALSPLIVWIALWIVNTYSKFQVNIFSNNRDITQCQKS